MRWSRKISRANYSLLSFYYKSYIYPIYVTQHYKHSTPHQTSDTGPATGLLPKHDRMCQCHSGHSDLIYTLVQPNSTHKGHPHYEGPPATGMGKVKKIWQKREMLPCFKCCPQNLYNMSYSSVSFFIGIVISRKVCLDTLNMNKRYVGIVLDVLLLSK